MGVGDGVDPTVIGSLDGSVLVRGGGYVDLSTGGGAVVSAGASSAEIQGEIDEAGASYVATGITRAVQLSAGRYDLAEPLTVPSGVHLIGAGEDLTELRAVWAMPLSAADDPENAMILIVGEIVGVSTLLTTVAPKDSRSLALASVAGLAAGDWIALEGHNEAATEQLLISSGSIVNLGDLVRVKSIVGLAVDVSDTPTLQHHTILSDPLPAAPRTTRKVAPVVGAAVRGMTLSARGGTIACGIHAEYCYDLEIDVAGAGFSRAVDDLRCCRKVNERLRMRGECNSGGIWRAVCDGTRLVLSDDGGSLFHANGMIRHAIRLDDRCTDVEATARLRHVSLGVNYVGGVNLQLDMSMQDIDATEAIVRDAGAFLLAHGFQAGTWDVPFNENAIGVAVTRLDMTNVRSSSVAMPSGYFHDTFGYNVTCVVSVACDGLDPSTPGAIANGIQYQDINGSLGGLRANGVNRACVYSGGQNDFDHGPLYIRNTPGYGANASVGLDFEYRNQFGVASNGPRIRDIAIDNYNFPVSFNALAYGDWPAFPDWWLRLDKISIDNSVSVNLVPALNATGVNIFQGYAVEIDPTAPAGVRRVRNAGGPIGPPSILCVACSLVPIGQFGLFALLPTERASVAATAAAVAVRDLLELDATMHVIANNASAAPIGRALVAKAAGAGLVAMGPL